MDKLHNRKGGNIMEKYLGLEYEDLAEREQYIKDNADSIENMGYTKPIPSDQIEKLKETLADASIKKLELSDDKRGNQKILRAQTVESNLPKSFNVNMPIFKGTEKRTFEVEVEINPNDLSCTLVSPDAHDIVVQERDNQMDAVLGRIGDAAPNIVIIEQ